MALQDILQGIAESPDADLPTISQGLTDRITVMVGTVSEDVPLEEATVAEEAAIEAEEELMAPAGLPPVPMNIPVM